MSLKKAFAFTLLELVVVVIIIGILATLGMVNYKGIKERELNREAKANLKLIRSAERIYRMEMGSYVKTSDANETSDMLKLALPKGDDRNWDYKVDPAAASSFTAKAVRRMPPPPYRNERVWCINQTAEEAFDNSTASCGWL